VSDLKRVFEGWEFELVDARGHSSGLITGWSTRSFVFSNFMSVALGLGMVLFSKEIDKEVMVLNLYGSMGQTQIEF
jgi:hypothetical protein